MMRPSPFRTAILAAITLAAAGLAGCQADRSPAGGQGDPYPPPMNDPQITVLSPELRNWIVFHPAIITGGDEAPLDVQVPVRNTTDRQYLIDYRFLFYDANGREVEPLMGWHMASLGPRQTVRLTANALDTQATSHRLEVKWAR